MLAVLYDIHGNLAALEAVLADAEAAGAERFLLGGDLVPFGPRPAETLARLRALPAATWIRGNAERWMTDPSDAPSPMDEAAAAARAAIGEEATRELTALPTSARADGSTVAWHASYQDDMAGFTEEAAGALDPTARRMLVGHTHRQFRREVEGVEVINPGSVGVPLDGDHRAAYALLREDGTVELRRVAYDWRTAASDLRALGTPAAELVAGRIERAAP